MDDNPNNFAPLKDTWSTRSDLMYDEWQPYPEFVSNQKYTDGWNGCNGNVKENYSATPKGVYANLQETWSVQKPFQLG